CQNLCWIPLGRNHFLRKSVFISPDTQMTFMRYLIILSFLLAALNAQTQNRIQLRDGSLIEYKKSKKRGDKKLFQLPSKEWKEVSSDDIVCYCNADGQIRYQQPVGLSEIDKLLEGRINVYIGYDMG